MRNSPQKPNAALFSATLLCTALSAVLSAVLSAGVLAQGPQRPIAITNARIVTMEGETIEMGTVLIRNGKIQDVGKDVKVPPGTKLVDAKGGTVMPGLVSAYSRVGLMGSPRPVQTINVGRRGRGRPRGGRGGGSRGGAGRNSAATKVALGIYPRQEIFRKLLEAGVTSLALQPSGSGFPGQGALLDLTGKTRDTLVVNDSAFLAVNPSNSTKAKKLLKDTFAAAKKLVAERKKPKEPAKKPAAKPTGKPAGKPGDKPASTTGKKDPKEKKEEPKPGPKPGPTPPKPEPKPDPKPEPKPDPKPTDGGTPPKTTKTAAKPVAKKPAPKKKDPNLEVLADLIEGNARAFLAVSSATDMLHYLDAVGDTRFTATILAQRINANQGTLDLVADKIKELKAGVLMTAQLSSNLYTDHITNPAAELHKAGIKVGFIVGDSPAAAKQLFSNLMTLVRHGLDTDVALKAVTLVPAEMLGIEDRVGSIKAGKDANLMLFTGDPLDPISTLDKVWLKGKLVSKDATENR